MLVTLTVDGRPWALRADQVRAVLEADDGKGCVIYFMDDCPDINASTGFDEMVRLINVALSTGGA